MARIHITVERDNLDARLRGIVSTLTRGEAARAGGVEMEGAIKDHIHTLAYTRHGSAHRLGASPTGHYREEAVNLHSTDADSATVAVSIPGIARAYRDIDIRPVRGNALTIPIHAWAYGKTVAEVRDSGRDVFRPRKKDYLATLDEGGELVALYLLRKHVHQPRDSSLMPADETLQESFLRGVQMAVDHYGGTQ